jgi:hypothetical protein
MENHGGTLPLDTPNEKPHHKRPTPSLEQVPPWLNRGDSRWAVDARIFRLIRLGEAVDGEGVFCGYAPAVIDRAEKGREVARYYKMSPIRQ